VTGGGEEVRELVHDGRRELPAARAEDVPRRADADPASVRILCVLVGMGVDVWRQRRTVHALAYRDTSHAAVVKKFKECHGRLNG
jgi:hypothetical protein